MRKRQVMMERMDRRRIECVCRPLPAADEVLNCKLLFPDARLACLKGYEACLPSLACLPAYLPTNLPFCPIRCRGLPLACLSACLPSLPVYLIVAVAPTRIRGLPTDHPA